MRNPVIALCLGAVSLICVGGSANAADMVYKAPPAAVVDEPPAPGPSRYYSDYRLFGELWTGYGPFYDCNGGRCYVGPPSPDGRSARRHFGQYYYGSTGGYYRGGWDN